MSPYSPGFADIMLPVIFVLFAFALAGALIWLADRYWPRGRENQRAGCGRPRYVLRLCRYKLTRRMPGRCPRRDPYRLSGSDRAEFGGILIALREDGACAAEPQRERRQP